MLSESTYATLLLDQVPVAAHSLEAAAARDGNLRTAAHAWWAQSRSEYEPATEWEALARVCLLHWLNRFVFAHYLKKFSSSAQQVDSIGPGLTPSEATGVFAEIIRASDFGTVLGGGIGDEAIGDVAWQSLTDLNSLLRDIKFEDIPPSVGQRILESACAFSRRKAAGQFVTPPALARFLVDLVIDDTHGVFFDPCCGTGTIARAAYDLKVRSGADPRTAISTVWAEDKFSFPVQIASLVLADPLQLGEIHRIFQSDALTLNPGDRIPFRHPFKGTQVDIALPAFDCIASNLPFIRFEDRPVTEITSVEAWLMKTAGAHLDARSDYFAYFPLWTWQLLSPTGQAGFITGNSWLGAAWGDQFRALLQRFYSIRAVIVSGEGRWFDETDVVTSIMLLSRRPEVLDILPSDERTAFATLRVPIDALEDDGLRSQVCDAVLNERTEP
ncbi:N-6 DNA methylase, partial [mine drainage metagenome]